MYFSFTFHLIYSYDSVYVLFADLSEFERFARVVFREDFRIPRVDYCQRNNHRRQRNDTVGTPRAAGPMAARCSARPTQISRASLDLRPTHRRFRSVCVPLRSGEPGGARSSRFDRHTHSHLHASFTYIYIETYRSGSFFRCKPVQRVLSPQVITDLHNIPVPSKRHTEPSVEFNQPQM